jgi:hypothetical protein
MDQQNQRCENGSATKTIHILTAIVIKILATFFRDREINPTVHMEAKKTLNNQSKPEPEEQSWRYHTPDIKLHYRALAIKAARYWDKNRHEDQ